MIILPMQNNFEQVKADTYAAICYGVVDLGTQFSQFYSKASRKILIQWELPNAKMSDGRPFMISKRYTLASGTNSSLRKDLESWRGAAFADADFGTFDIGKLLGVPCLIGVTVSDRSGVERSDVTSIMRLPKEMTVSALTNEKIYFSLNNFSQAVFDKLSDGLKAIINKSPEYQEIFKETIISNQEAVPF